MDHKEKALWYFNRHFHCSQAVLAAFADDCGITEHQALMLGSCFGSGMRKGEVCGACTGALMVLGLLYGYDDPAVSKDKGRADEVNDMMMERFSERCGSYLCNVILDCDISTSEGVKHARDNRLFTEICPKAVETAVDILENIIEEMDRYHEHDRKELHRIEFDDTSLTLGLRHGCPSDPGYIENVLFRILRTGSRAATDLRTGSIRI
ncbi:C-GCAxxG-C-C family protein [Methanomethylophilus alvi]|uniref:C-GCAxxG-C-C family protein n=1 Tax=Methanomethylophilus alvi TaxID=1291540 RepID=UPI0037DC0637